MDILQLRDPSNPVPSQPFTLSNITDPIPNAIIYGFPLGIASAQPWWSSFPGAFIDVIIALKSITIDWTKDMKHVEPEDWYGPLTGRERVSTAIVAGEVTYMFVQVISGLAYYGTYSWRKEFLKYGSPVSYVLVFAAGSKLWTRLVMRNIWMKIATWISALLSSSFCFTNRP